MIRSAIFVVALFGASLGNAFGATPGLRSDQEMAGEYTRFWRTALAASSGITESALAPLIHVDATEISTWDAGKTFRIRYTVQWDWLSIPREDRFIVWINATESGYRHLELPRDTWLTNAHLQTVIAQRVFDSALGRVDARARLAFRSLAEAEDHIRVQNKLAALDQVEVTFYVPGKIPREDGMPYLVWFATVDERANAGMKGYLNLVTGDGKSWTDALQKSIRPTDAFD